MFQMNERLHLVSDSASAERAAPELAGDFEGLVQAEHLRLYGALWLITRDAGETEDVMQEAFLRVWERWDRVGAMDDPAGYLYRTALNVYRQRIRRASVAVRCDRPRRSEGRAGGGGDPRSGPPRARKAHTETAGERRTG
jgi:DNA-directed RNA polymerase specialized sigma24 family protein